MESGKKVLLLQARGKNYLFSQQRNICGPMLRNGLDLQSLKLRLLRIHNGSEVQILITSLIDTQLYPIDIFNDLYHSRWPVEEDYKVIKLRVEVENWSGKSALSICQDFHAKVFTANLTAILAQPA